MYFVEKTKGIDFFRNFDWFLFVIVILLNTIGMIVLYSTSTRLQDGTSLLVKQSIGIAIGFVLFIVISLIDYKDFKILGVIAYALTTILLVLVLIIGAGKEQVGTTGWILLGPLSVQPSELAKITFVLVLAIYFERIISHDGKYNIPIILGLAAVPIGLILKQPDVGTMLVYIFILILMIFVCGLPYKYIFASAGAFLASLPVFWLFILKDYQKNRILSFFNTEYDPRGANFQVITSKRAIGSGQLWGKGLLQGGAAKNVPEAETDFIFSVIGEELGFIGAALVTVLFLAFVIRCLYIAHNARDQYGSFLIIGLTAMFIFHFFENIGMCIGIMPVTGIPLPFISSGANGVMTNYIALGVIMSVSLRRKRLLFE